MMCRGQACQTSDAPQGSRDLPSLSCSLKHLGPPPGRSPPATPPTSIPWALIHRVLWVGSLKGLQRGQSGFLPSAVSLGSLPNEDIHPSPTCSGTLGLCVSGWFEFFQKIKILGQASQFQ